MKYGFVDLLIQVFQHTLYYPRLHRPGQTTQPIKVQIVLDKLFHALFNHHGYIHNFDDPGVALHGWVYYKKRWPISRAFWSVCSKILQLYYIDIIYQRVRVLDCCWVDSVPTVSQTRPVCNTMINQQNTIHRENSYKCTINQYTYWRIIMCIHENLFFFAISMLLFSGGLNLWFLCKRHQWKQWVLSPKDDELVYNFQIRDAINKASLELPPIMVSK